MVARTDHLPLSWQKCAPLPNGNPPALRTWFLTKRIQRSMRGWILQVFRQFWSTGPTASSVSGLTTKQTNMATRDSVIRLILFPTLGVCWKVRDPAHRSCCDVDRGPEKLACVERHGFVDVAHRVVRRVTCGVSYAFGEEDVLRRRFVPLRLRVQ